MRDIEIGCPFFQMSIEWVLRHRQGDGSRGTGAAGHGAGVVESLGPGISGLDARAAVPDCAGERSLQRVIFDDLSPVRLARFAGHWRVLQYTLPYQTSNVGDVQRCSVLVTSMVKHFRVSGMLRARLEESGVRVSAVLRRARLPRDLFDQTRILVSTEELFALWSAIGEVSNDPAIGLKLATETKTERFHRMGIAALSTESLGAAVEHMARYKRLSAP